MYANHSVGREVQAVAPRGPGNRPRHLLLAFKALVHGTSLRSPLFCSSRHPSFLSSGLPWFLLFPPSELPLPRFHYGNSSHPSRLRSEVAFSKKASSITSSQSEPIFLPLCVVMPMESFHFSYPAVCLSIFHVSRPRTSVRREKGWHLSRSPLVSRNTAIRLACAVSCSAYTLSNACVRESLGWPHAPRCWFQPRLGRPGVG